MTDLRFLPFFLEFQSKTLLTISGERKADLTMNERFQETCSRFFCNGLLAAVVTDRDGVVILKSIAKDAAESFVDPTIATTFAVANNQASKLGLEQNKKIISVYDQYQLIQLDKAPLILTLLAQSSANTGLFVTLSDELSSLTEPLVAALNE